MSSVSVPVEQLLSHASTRDVQLRSFVCLSICSCICANIQVLIAALLCNIVYSFISLLITHCFLDAHPHVNMNAGKESNPIYRTLITIPSFIVTVAYHLCGAGK